MLTQRQFDFVCSIAGEDMTVADAIRFCVNEAMLTDAEKLEMEVAMFHKCKGKGKGKGK